MGSKNCVNGVCRATASSEWKKGWSLKSGGFATLCYNCGSAYENSVFCETFHSNESGWRECRMCRKRIHCGCIASRYLHEYMDFGGIGCITCVKRMAMDIHPMQPIQIAGDIPTTTFVTNGIRDVHPTIVNNTKRLLQLTETIEANDLHSAPAQPKREDFTLKTGESTKNFPNFGQPYTPSPFIKGNSRPKQGVKDVYESPAQPSLNYSLTASLNNDSSPVLSFNVGVVEGGEQNKGSSQQGQKTRHLLLKFPKSSPVAGGSESSKASGSQLRVARPPAEGRGRNQLLPRYWPRITDQELQQLSGDLKSTIVPLFEKILSASDAGRIGRLVLPKACAESYFPAINQSEGIPIRIQDIKGKEWTFQFRFWPNNNSRMYVLEGVTPCIQSMQLQAGDTVTFSRIDPGGQLVIGCRKATNNADMLDSQASYGPNGDSNGETSFSGATDNLLSEQMTMSEKKTRNIKNKRLLMHTVDATELRVTWEETQELLRPSPDSEKAIFMVEDHEFEEFEEPPVFGKRTIFTSRPSGEQEQLAQCDTCSKWRRLPVNALLSAKWTCLENIWDSNRSSCSALEDINPRDLEFYFGINKDSKQRRIPEDKSSPSGLDALATAAVLGDNIMPETGESSMEATTTRHPRHRPGCSCIVCIQPPSGTGKHESMCKCNVCLTVKRRFKTLMMRKKRQREAKLAQEEKDKHGALEGKYIDVLASVNVNNNSMESEMINEGGEEMDLGEEGKEGGLDLNCDPHREDDILAEPARMSLMNGATLPPTDGFLEEESEVVPSLRRCLVSQNADDGEKSGVDGRFMEGNVETGKVAE